MMSKTYDIVISPGDGCGYEIIGWAQKVLETVSTRSGYFRLNFIPVEIGFGAYQKTGEALSKASLDAMRSADATLFVAIAAAEMPRHLPNPIIVMRKELDLYGNMRPLGLSICSRGRANHRIRKYRGFLRH
jgi:methanogen homoisocitrate dehydrogenase